MERSNTSSSARILASWAANRRIVSQMNLQHRNAFTPQKSQKILLQLLITKNACASRHNRLPLQTSRDSMRSTRDPVVRLLLSESEVHEYACSKVFGLQFLASSLQSYSCTEQTEQTWADRQTLATLDSGSELRNACPHEDLEDSTLISIFFDSMQSVHDSTCKCNRYGNDHKRDHKMSRCDVQDITSIYDTYPKHNVHVMSTWCWCHPAGALADGLQAPRYSRQACDKRCTWHRVTSRVPWYIWHPVWVYLGLSGYSWVLHGIPLFVAFRYTAYWYCFISHPFWSLDFP